jgi:hypothetical protein
MLPSIPTRADRRPAGFHARGPTDFDGRLVVDELDHRTEVDQAFLDALVAAVDVVDDSPPTSMRAPGHASKNRST